MTDSSQHDIATEDSRTRAMAICAGAYLVAIAGAAATGYVLRDLHPLAMIAAADGVGTLIIFAFSFAFKNSSFYDPYWSVAPMVIAVYWLVAPVSEGADFVRQIVVTILVGLWGTRLTFNWLRQWKGLGHEDWRYINLQEQNGRAYWLVSFSGIHFFPTVLVYLGCLPLFPVFTAQARPFGWVDGLAAFLTLAAIWIEARADNQLRHFVLTNSEPGRVLDTGLWAYCRHPNYLGEILFWWGLFLFAMAASPGLWWTVAGAASITILFVFISVPMLDKRHLQRRPDYAEHMAKLPSLIPRPRKKISD